MIETSVEAAARDRTEVIRQAIKWTVYSLLLLNWTYYMFDDWRVAQHTVLPGAPLTDWMQAFATTLDELAWFTLLFLFEAETYWLSDDAMTRLKRALFVLLRIACYGFLAHTVYAYVMNFVELRDATLIAASGVCELADQGISFLRNLEYTDITSANCATLSAGGPLYQIEGPHVITDAAGLSEATFLGVVDIEDALVWLAVVVIIELVVIMQERGISEGPAISIANFLTMALYAVLICNALYWAWKGHWVYAWDELLWIGGFAAIEMNLSEWRDEMSEEAVRA